MTKTDGTWRAVGDAIRQRMDVLSLTQAELGRLSGVSDTTIRAVLRGEPIQRRDKRRELAEALGWQADAVDRLLTGRKPVVLKTPERPVVSADELGRLLERVQQLEAELAALRSER